MNLKNSVRHIRCIASPCLVFGLKLLMVVFLMVSVPGQAQPEEEKISVKNDVGVKDAEEVLLQEILLQELAEKISAYDSVEGSFSQERTITGLPLALKSSGIFNYSASSGIVWHTRFPLEAILSVTKEGVSQNNSTVFSGSNVLTDTLLGVFSGRMSDLKQYFHIHPKGTEQKWSIVLTPSNASIASQLKKITLRGGEFIHTIIIDEALGDRSTISLQGLTMLKSHSEEAEID